MVGRSEELDFLMAQFEAVARGDGGRLIFISGEPGVGKTRLAQEVGSYARLRGGSFLAGHYLRDGTPPYGPWVEALRAGLRGLNQAELAEAVGSAGTELAQILPELTERFGPFPPLTPSAPEEQRRRLSSAAVSTTVSRD